MPISCGLTRRHFTLSLCGLPFSSSLFGAEESRSMPWNEPATVAKVYLAGSPMWPKPTLDVASEIRDIEAKLVEVQRRHTENVRLVGGEVLHSDADIEPWLAKTRDVDGILIIPLTQPTPAARVLDVLPAPAVFFSRPYATHMWSAIGRRQKQGTRIDVVASSSYGDLDPYMRAFRTIHHMRKSKVLVGVATEEHARAGVDAFSKAFGTTFKIVKGNEFKAAFEAADARKAQKEADEFTRNALKVVDATKEDISKGLRFYLALAEMLKQEQANAVTIDCFGTLAANTLPGYPCIAWSKFNDAGLYGVCEADLSSTMTQIMITSYTGMPGFVSDPVFDTSRNEVIHAHCVSATRMKGLNGPAAPYILRNHLETNEGAVVQVMMPSDERITVAQFGSPKQVLISTAEVTGAVDSDRGCRSQIRTRVADADKWLHNYTANLHRVIFYGDHVRTVERLGRLLDFEVVREV